MSDRQHTNAEQNTPISDRLSAIRARLDAWHDMEPVEQSLSHPDEYVADIAWLLEQVEDLTKRVRMYEVVKS